MSELLPAYSDSLCKRIAIKLAPNLDLKQGTVLGMVTQSDGPIRQYTYRPYSKGNEDGSQTAVGLLAIDAHTDDNGDFTSTDATGRESLRVSAPLYYKGEFRTQDLIGLDAEAVKHMGRLIAGTVNMGVIALK